MYLQLMYLQLMYLQSHIYKNIPVSFDFITTWKQGVFLCSPCISSFYDTGSPENDHDWLQYVTPLLWFININTNKGVLAVNKCSLVVHFCVI